MSRQVGAAHYHFAEYMTKKRWASIWHQLAEVLLLQPDSVLEVGPGPGVFKACALALGVQVKTLDIDETLHPDLLGSAIDIPAENDSFDVACAFQVLEHMPFEKSLLALRELGRVSRKGIVISLPDATTRWPSTITLPRIGAVNFMLKHPFFRARPHAFDGQHYWEIGKQGYSVDDVMKELAGALPEFSLRTFLVPENPYHRFFVLSAAK